MISLWLQWMTFLLPDIIMIVIINSAMYRNNKLSYPIADPASPFFPGVFPLTKPRPRSHHRLPASPDNGRLQAHVPSNTAWHWWHWCQTKRGRRHSGGPEEVIISITTYYDFSIIWTVISLLINIKITNYWN